MPFPFVGITHDQYTAMVSDGAAGRLSPLLADDVFTGFVQACREENIDERLLLAWLRAENNMATNISTGLLAVHNAAGIKYVGQSRAYASDQYPPSNEQGVYAGFKTWDDFFWTLAVNIETILPDAWAHGDLGKIASYYTTGDPNAGGGASKVTFYHDYLARYPTGGTPTPIPDGSGVYGEDIVAALVPHIGEDNSDGTLDPWNGPHPWPGYCEASTEGAQYRAGLIDVVHRPSAAAKLDAVTQQGLLQTTWPPEDGAICLWGRSFDPNGHATVWSAAKGMWISTLYPPHHGLDYYYSDAWRAAMAGWYRGVGVVAANRTQPTPAPTPVQMPVFVDGNPYGAIPIRAPFWNKWDAVNCMGTKLDHPGAVNPTGNALPLIGFPMEPERTLSTGRRIQRFERGYLAVNNGGDPFDCVMLLVSEQPR